ncbi:MAG: hypothetical protein JO027_01495, partial [Solirubrobacterales bacterium]|nr:hypothetical protein [Solirubrobacterales bacterium]
MISNKDAPAAAPSLLPSAQTHSQRPAEVVPGLPVAIAVIVIGVAAIILIVVGKWAALFGPALLIVFAFGAGGILVVQPNESRVLILFGRYAGTVTEAGLWWCNPFNKRKKISLRVHNFQSDRIKVNDASGNPIEIAAVIVWRVTDTAKAVFDVADYNQFVTV